MHFFSSKSVSKEEVMKYLFGWNVAWSFTLTIICDQLHYFLEIISIIVVKIMF